MINVSESFITGMDVDDDDLGPDDDLLSEDCQQELGELGVFLGVEIF